MFSSTRPRAKIKPPSLSRGRRPINRHDGGESLIELLVTIVVLGLTVPAILGAVALSVTASYQDRRQVQAQALLSSWAETITNVTNTDTVYGACLTATDYAAPKYQPPGLPPASAGISLSVVNVSYWDTSSGLFVSSCAPLADPGIRKIQLKITVASVGASSAFDKTQSIVVRKPCTAC